MTRTLLTAAACGLLVPPAFSRTFVYNHENVLGTSLELRVDAATEQAADAAEARTLAEVDRLTAVLSTYRPDSEISRWLAAPHGPVAVSPDLHAVLLACDRWESLSGGAFNARVEILTQLWKQSAAAGSVPDNDHIAAALERMKAPAWHLAGGTAERTGDCPVSVNALAKGYIIQKAGECAHHTPDVSAVLLNIGGDLQVWGGGEHTVSIANPHADAENAAPLTQAVLHAQSLATSGSYRRGTDAAGRHRSHIFDPRTGQPADGVLSASVIAADATTADALATVFCVLPPAESVRMARSLPGVSCLIVTEHGIVRSTGWPEAPGAAFVQTPAAEPEKKDPPGEKKDPPAADNAAAAWGLTHELLVNYEINAPGGGRVHRPYIAIWVEDKAGIPVRTLTLLMKPGKGDRWLPDLKRWHRSDRARQEAGGKALAPAISAATRQPGAYSVVWDGTGNDGTAIPPGTYTLYIEAAREHGTYQIMKKEITVGGAPIQEKMEGNVEIKSAALEYRQKAAK